MSVIGTTVLSEVIFRYVAGITIGLVVFTCVEVAHGALSMYDVFDRLIRVLR